MERRVGRGGCVVRNLEVLHFYCGGDEVGGLRGHGTRSHHGGCGHGLGEKRVEGLFIQPHGCVICRCVVAGIWWGGGRL
jgi:hypothetical protein